MTIDPIYFNVSGSWDNGRSNLRWSSGNNWNSWNSWNSYYPTTIIDDVLWRNGHHDVLKDPSFFGYDPPFMSNNTRWDWHNSYHRDWAVDNWGRNHSWESSSSSDLYQRYGLWGNERYHRSDSSNSHLTFGWNGNSWHSSNHHSESYEYRSNNDWGWNPWILY